VFANRWSVSAQYQYSPTAFKTDEDIYYAYGKEKRYYGYVDGDMTVHGCGLNFLFYLNDYAPTGYYLKLGVDAFFYNISVPYTAFDTLVRTQEGYSYKDEYIYYNTPGIYTARDWAMGVRFEIGRNFFIGRYLSLGTSLSCGLLCKDWGNLIYNSAPQFINAANKRLLTSYIGGISIKIGFLPF
jgi:hypothetical protein